MSNAARTPPSTSIIDAANCVAAGHAPMTRAQSRPLSVSVAAGLLGGVSFALWLPWLAPVWLLVAAAVIGAPAWWGAWRGRWFGACLLGFALAGLHATHALSVQLPMDWEKRDVEVRGRIVELPLHQPRRTAFVLRVDRGSDQPEPLRGRLLRLSWYDERDGSGSGREQLQAGQQWQMKVRLRAPRGLRNPGGMDTEKHAFARRVSASGYIREPGTARLESARVGINAWRGAMSERIAKAIPPESARFISAFALGDTRGLDDVDWHVLRANGLSHLVAISGMHVGIVAGFFALAVSGAWWVFPGLGRRVPRPIAAAVGGFAGALMYAAVAGFALPTVRTVLMVAVVAGTRIQRRRSTTLEVLALAMIAVLVVDPLAALTAGFWLSFFGVAWLVWCLPEAGRRPLHDLVSAQGVATVGLLPLTAVLFDQASVVGPLANMVAVPWWTLVVVPLSLVGTALELLHAGWGLWAWNAAAWCFQLSWPLFDAMAGNDLALWWLRESRWYALPLALAGAFWLLLPRGLPGRPLALLLWLPLLWPARDLPAPGEVEIRVLDVGQGSSVLVRTAVHNLLYDMGPSTPDGFDSGERVVIPALRALGVGRLDRAVVSHADNDHGGGFDAVRNRIPVAIANAPEDSGVSDTLPCVAGEQWDWDGVSFRFMHPPPYFPYLGNDASCVLRITGKHGSALLLGDVGKVIERDLVRRSRLDADADIRADVVLVSHHGAANASDPALVEATGARFAIMSTGHGNRYGHPRAEVSQRWQDAGAATPDTSRDGSLKVRMGEGGITLETRRAARPRLWDAVRRENKAQAEGAAGLSYRPD